MENLAFPTQLQHQLSTMSMAIPRTSVVTSDWRQALPVLAGSMVTLREVVVEDARALHELLSTEEVARFITPPPTTVEGFEKFITWAQAQRREGKFICYAVVPHGLTSAIGLFQVRKFEGESAEWGFALGSSFWGTGVFIDAARQVIDFAFGDLGLDRLEARAAVENGRGNGALKKLGAVREGVLRRTLKRHDVYHDQVVWSILADDVPSGIKPFLEENASPITS